MIDAVLIGGGGHAKSVADAVKRAGIYNIIGIVSREKEDWDEYPWLGNDDELQKIYDSGVKNAIFGIGYLGKGDVRRRVYDNLVKIGFELPAIIDPSAVISEDTEIGTATFIGKGCIVNKEAKIGKATIINTGAIIEHECRIGDFTHIAVGARICGDVEIGEDVFIGAGATVIQCIKVGNKTAVGAGAAVVYDVPERCVAVGVPAKVIKERV
jgi:sugar O-acyltransferase (sialic acid O-acetyltransferase NeuD family)